MGRGGQGGDDGCGVISVDLGMASDVSAWIGVGTWRWWELLLV